MNMEKIVGNIACVASGVFVLWVFLSWLSLITINVYPQYNFFTMLCLLYRVLSLRKSPYMGFFLYIFIKKHIKKKRKVVVL